MSSLTEHPRSPVLKSGGRDRHGRLRHRAQIQDLKVGDVLAGFGKVLEWREVEPEGGWRYFHMRTEHPQHYPTVTDTFVRPAYIYYEVMSLAD